MALICKKGALKGRLEGIQPSAGARFFRLAEVQKQLGVSRSTQHSHHIVFATSLSQFLRQHVITVPLIGKP